MLVQMTASWYDVGIVGWLFLSLGGHAMKRRSLLPVAIALAMFISLLWGPLLCAQTKTPKGKTPKPESYIVIQTGDDFEVVKQSELAARKKKASEKFQQDLKAYQTAKKEAVKTKEKFDMPRPVETRIKRVGSKTFKTQADAETFRDNHVKELEERKSTQKK
jgi:hypothetical protein